MATVAPESAMNGLDPMFNPEWYLTEEQLGLLERLRTVCEETIRPLAAENDRTLTFPRKSLEALAPDGFLGLMLPKEWGGLGQNHVMYAHVTETLARYGDASCAMCYVMHIGAVEALKLRPTEYTIEKYLKKVREGLIGTLSYSDPETGSHFWYPIASGARRVDGGFEVLKKASWTTSAGFADFYVLQTTSPDYGGDYSNLSVFVVDKDEIEAKPEEWDAMGLRGNQSGSLLLDWKFVPEEQMVGPVGDGANSNDESVDPELPDRLVRHVERHLARRDRHRHPPHDPKDPQGRGPSGVRLPDDSGHSRRGDHGHERLAGVRLRRRAGPRRRDRRVADEPGRR